MEWLAILCKTCLAISGLLLTALSAQAPRVEMNAMSLALSALVSATTALLIVGPLEARKRRVGRLADRLGGIEDAARDMVNSVRVLRERVEVVASLGHPIDAVSEDGQADRYYARLTAAYREAKPHMVGHQLTAIETIAGNGLTAAASMVERVDQFRRGGVGWSPDALHTHYEAMQADLASADVLLRTIIKALQAGYGTRRIRALRLDQSVEKATRAVRTPPAYYIFPAYFPPRTYPILGFEHLGWRERRRRLAGKGAS